MESARLKVTGMHCASCGMLIDETLEDLPGVRASATHVRSATTVVQFDPATIQPEEIIRSIGELGYAASLASRSQ